jgi:hypothetical protein
VFLAETAAREMPHVTLLDALDFLWLVANEAPDRFERTAHRWFERLVTERNALNLDELQLALACPRRLRSAEHERLRDVPRALAGGRQSSSGPWR